MSDVPLTPEQRLFASEHHGLVYAFLKERNLSVNEYYDVIIFGFLRAVRRYFTEADLREYKFSTIAWNCMYVDLCNHFKAQHRQKRTATVVSIHVSKFDDGLSYEETIAPPDELMQQLEARLLLHDLSKRVSKQQMDMVRLRGRGYSDRDIAQKQNISMSQVKKLLNEVRLVLKAMCYE